MRLQVIGMKEILKYLLIGLLKVILEVKMGMVHRVTFGIMYSDVQSLNLVHPQAIIFHQDGLIILLLRMVIHYGHLLLNKMVPQEPL